MRLIVTSDLHYNHARSRPMADELIARINRERADALLLVGDTAVADGDSLERCLSLFTFDGPRLFVAGNHELWTSGDDSHHLYTYELPRRVSALGWTWLEGAPCVVGDVAIVGNLGWYDYSFAQPELGIPPRFYEHKVSPGAARALGRFAHLFDGNPDDVPPVAMELVARWNDGKFVKLHRSDEQFLDERLAQLARDLDHVRGARAVLAAVHHLPFAALLPPPHSAQWDFAKAYLGSDRIGELLLRYQNVRDVVCGHSHFAAEARVGGIRAVSLGSGYRAKTFHAYEL
jgi:3',5'-cyclic AMP phosphodiesterase CpdA